jgi:Ca2+-transporting ATPase
MEKAFNALGERRLASTEHLHPHWTLVRQYPLSDQLLALSHVWREPDGDVPERGHVIAAKGAYEAIADLCHLTPAQAAPVERAAHDLAAEGLRVLGVARARLSPGPLPAQQHDFDFGLVGLADPSAPRCRRPSPSATPRGSAW